MIPQQTSGVDFLDRGQTTYGLVTVSLFVCYVKRLYMHINKISYGITDFVNMSNSTLALGGHEWQLPSALFHGEQESQELSFILNSFRMSYLVKGHFPAL